MKLKDIGTTLAQRATEDSSLIDVRVFVPFEFEQLITYIIQKTCYLDSTKEVIEKFLKDEGLSE